LRVKVLAFKKATALHVIVRVYLSLSSRLRDGEDSEQIYSK